MNIYTLKLEKDYYGYYEHGFALVVLAAYYNNGEEFYLHVFTAGHKEVEPLGFEIGDNIFVARRKEWVQAIPSRDSMYKGVPFNAKGCSVWRGFSVKKLGLSNL